VEQAGIVLFVPDFKNSVGIFVANEIDKNLPIKFFRARRQFGGSYPFLATYVAAGFLTVNLL